MSKSAHFIPKSIFLLLPVILLSACGAWQTVSNGTANAFHAVFYKQVESVDVDVSAREALNPDDAGRATSVAVRVYQLSDRKLFDAASYDDLVKQDRKVLGDERRASMAGVLNPGASLNLSQPIEDDVKYVAVVAFFRNPGSQETWRYVIPAKKLDADTPLKLRLGDYRIDQVNGEKRDGAS
ncbi:type VI secretion system lipoprotein TssJ [Pandoraea fibrosis]|uniref:Type VI secretion system-associated lipoprotein n=1 Tax=Pandoraea fibrosis TaxID=1891094 RepID=A0A5E4W821_9BURK|nr:type VI secretion system lipoprotein TssJ [Pandoraea fibrosis]VVE19410.1 type VI secretion system-associated lipoprotein [Pandoraea fibrosis]